MIAFGKDTAGSAPLLAHFAFAAGNKTSLSISSNPAFEPGVALTSMKGRASFADSGVGASATLDHNYG